MKTEDLDAPVYSAGDVLGRDEYEFVPINSWAEGELSDSAAGNAAADGGTVEHAGQNHVVDIARMSGDFVATFHAGN